MQKVKKFVDKWCNVCYSINRVLYALIMQETDIRKEREKYGKKSIAN